MLKESIGKMKKEFKSIKFIQLKDIDISIKHPSEIKREYVENGVLFLRVQNIKSLNLDIENNFVFVSHNDAEKLSKNLIFKNDIVMSRTESCGDCVVYNLDSKLFASSRIFMIKNTFFNQSFLVVFFNTKFGKIQINRGKYGSVQLEIAPTYLKNTFVPLFDIFFQKEIENLVKESYEKLEKSKSLYKEAENLLLEKLGVTNLSTQTTHNSTSKDKYPHLNIA